MTPNPGKMNKVKGAFDKVVEWDKKLIKKCQDKWGLTDYQVVCISFAKGFIIGAILLRAYLQKDLMVESGHSDLSLQ